MHQNHHVKKWARILSTNKPFLIATIVNKPSPNIYFKKLFENIIPDWSKIYLLSGLGTTDTTLCSFQNKIFNNVLFLNKNLYNFGIKALFFPHFERLFHLKKKCFVLEITRFLWNPQIFKCPFTTAEYWHNWLMSNWSRLLNWKGSENFLPCLYLLINQVGDSSWSSKDIYPEMYLVLCTNTHAVTDLVNHGMVKNAKTWISGERKQFLTCVPDLRSYCFVVEVTLMTALMLNLSAKD